MANVLRYSCGCYGDMSAHSQHVGQDCGPCPVQPRDCPFPAAAFTPTDRPRAPGPLPLSWGSFTIRWVAAMHVTAYVSHDWLQWPLGGLDRTVQGLPLPSWPLPLGQTGWQWSRLPSPWAHLCGVDMRRFVAWEPEARQHPATWPRAFAVQPGRRLHPACMGIVPHPRFDSFE